MFESEVAGEQETTPGRQHSAPTTCMYPIGNNSEEDPQLPPHKKSCVVKDGIDEGIEQTRVGKKLKL